MSSIALATVKTENGLRFVCYNGPGEELTLETQDGSGVESLGMAAKSIDEAEELIEAHFDAERWDLRWIEDEEDADAFSEE